MLKDIDDGSLTGFSLQGKSLMELYNLANRPILKDGKAKFRWRERHYCSPYRAVSVDSYKSLTTHIIKDNSLTIVNCL